MEKPNEIWQVDAGGQIYETNFEELTQWIAEDALLPRDKVRRGNLRWIEAQKVPALIGFFNARELGFANQVVTSTNVQNAEMQLHVQNFSVHSAQPLTQNFQEPPPPTAYQEFAPETEINFCAVHTDAKAKYHCETCGSYFCKACPKNAICLMCGATCTVLNLPQPPMLAHQPIPQSEIKQEVFIDNDVRRGGNWIYWKAGLTMINAFLIMAGTDIQFVLGLTFPQIFQGILIGINEMSVSEGMSHFHGAVFVTALLGTIATAFIGYQAKQAKRWAFVLGIIIFSFDCVLTLLSFAFLGAIIHCFAIYQLSKGYSGSKNR